MEAVVEQLFKSYRQFNYSYKKCKSCIFLRKNVYETCETMIRIAITITIRKCHLLETIDLDKQTNKPKHDNIKDNETINLHNTKDT